MSTAMLNIFIRVVKKRMENGEELENILAGYTNLSDTDKNEIREVVK